MSEGTLSDSRALIPAGEYQAVYLYHETAFFRKTPKVYLHLKIFGGEYAGVRLYRAYRVKRLTGDKPKKYGGFTVNHSHAVYRQMVSISDAVTRPDRISLASLKGCVLRVRVRTVKRDAGGATRKPKALPDVLKYSVVDELLSIDAGTLESTA